jgi:glycerol kinase
VYIDGGFTANMVFVEILRQLLQPLEVMLTDSAQGTALGAAVALSKDKLHKHFLKKHYHLK